MLALLLAPFASAEPIPVTALEAVAKVSPVKVGVGGVFQGGSPFTAGPSGDLLTGLQGMSPGFGLSADVRALGIVGVEIDAIRSNDTGFTTFGAEDGESLEVRQPSWHVPVLLKLGLPSGPVRPNVQLGAQLIVPTESMLDVQGTSPFALAADASPYMTWTAGLGAEIALPFGPDIRLPIAYRAAFDTPSSRAAGARALYALDPDSRVVLSESTTEWRYHGALTVGLAYWF
ncbi:MAG: outer membrane beta-barrel protein [Myxococcales bacterium]|nr:outer membrane beta-barrel protein [Myxococcales bacterium]MCB9671355.1 outer membrane beta-barrel protein [Alphaproteobacteria bacterium]MCB9692211.1 outer membrane beta-barrel protein [Alphaproteobacteria bacterium]